jgi:hypothetical protein
VQKVIQDERPPQALRPKSVRRREAEHSYQRSGAERVTVRAEDRPSVSDTGRSAMSIAGSTKGPSH